MIVYRLVRAKYKDVLNGAGASRFGARWNSRGTEIIYTAKSRALAMAELLVHLDMKEVPDDYYMLSISIPYKAKIVSIDEADLPDLWNLSFEYRQVTREIGDKFIVENQYVCLEVPSAVVKGDCNILLNPLHKQFTKVRILEAETFPFDRRFFK